MANLALDLDGCIYPWHRAVDTELRIYWNLTESYEEFWSTGYKNYKNQMFWDNLCKLEHLYTTQIPDERDIAFVKELGKTNTIYYISHRPKDVEHVTRQWLKKYELPCPENLYLTKDKVAVANSFGITKFVEDNVETIIALTEAGIETFIVNQPRNMLFDLPNKRVNKLYELKGIL